MMTHTTNMPYLSNNCPAFFMYCLCNRFPRINLFLCINPRYSRIPFCSWANDDSLCNNQSNSISCTFSIVFHYISTHCSSFIVCKASCHWCHCYTVTKRPRSNLNRIKQLRFCNVFKRPPSVYICSFINTCRFLV